MQLQSGAKSYQPPLCGGKHQMVSSAAAALFFEQLRGGIENLKGAGNIERKGVGEKKNFNGSTLDMLSALDRSIHFRQFTSNRVLASMT